MKKRIDILLGLALILVVACDPLGEPINFNRGDGYDSYNAGESPGEGKGEVEKGDISLYSFNFTEAPDLTLPLDGDAGILTFKVDTDCPEDRLKDVALVCDEPWVATRNEGPVFFVEVAANGTERGRRAEIRLVDNISGTVIASFLLVQGWTGGGWVRFADGGFYRACLAEADADGDSLVSLDEASSVRELEIRHKGVRDLAGLEAFSNLEVFDAEGNEIVNADVFRELHHLRWFDLKGNPDLESFDLTGCTIYFDRCLFDTSEKLHYRTLLRQLNVTYECDPYSSCAEHIVDTRVSTDWSHHKNLVKIQEHTVGDGKKAVVLSGLGWLDVDIADGSFRRAMDDLLDYIYDINPCVKGHKDELDIYMMEYVSESRERFVYPLADFDEDYAEPLRNAYRDWRDEHFIDTKKAVFPDDNGKVLSISMDLHPNVKIVPLRTTGGTGRDWSRNAEFENIFVYQHNLTVTLDADNMDCFGRMDETFSRRKEYLYLAHEDGIKAFFGW